MPDNERARLESLRALNILDTLPEERFDRYTRLSQRLFGVPIALVSLVDADRQWFKSRQGVKATQTDRAVSFCGHAILGQHALVVNDAHEDERFANNPLVLGDPSIRFYAGRPLRTPQGHALGALCLIDHTPRLFSTEDAIVFDDLGTMVEQELVALRDASSDPLTGLSNRRGFIEIARFLLSACRRERKPAQMVFIDLDRFKEINDTHGHAAGDQALRDTADVLLSVFRGSDIIGRLGGDEFCVLCTNTSDKEGIRRRLVEAFAAHNARSRSPWDIRMSIGIVPFQPTVHRSIEELLVASDALMYAHKARRHSGG